MKTMKFIAATMLAALISTSTYAQENGKKRGGREMPKPKMDTLNRANVRSQYGTNNHPMDTINGRGKFSGGNRQASMSQKRLDDFSQKIGLNEEQKAKIQQIQQEQNTQLQTIRQDHNQTPEARREAMKAVLKNTDTQITAILDADQKVKYTLWKEDRKAQAKKEEDRKKMREINEEIESENLFK